MKKKIILFVLLLLVIYVAYIFISTGYFRTIENKFEGKILKKVNIVGAEDIIVIRKDSFAIISSTPRGKSQKEMQEQGGLYMIDLTSDDYTPIHLTKNFDKPFAPHGISLYKKGSAYAIAAISHTKSGESIEFFELIGDQLTYQKTVKNELIFSPNDLVLLDTNRFYVTNDHKYKKGFGRLAEDYIGLAIYNVIYCHG